MKYAIGFYNKPYDKDDKDFVIIAETKSSVAAEFIERSYNEGYKKAGMTTKAVTVIKNTLDSYRYAE